MPTRKKRLGAVVAGAAAIALAAGCTTTSSDAGDEEEMFRIAPGNFPQSLDGQYYPTELGVYNVVHQVLDPLVTVEDGEAQPALAESWQNPDENTWAFTLRETEFSDGTPFTARDAKASIERIIELNGPIAPLFSAVTEITADDERTLTIKTSEPVGTLLNSLSMVFIGKADAVGNEEYWQKPIGTGPFVVDEYVADDSVSMTPNESYWGESQTLDRVEVVNMPEVSSQITALQTGEIDAMTLIPPDQVESVDGVDDLTYSASDSYKYLVTWFNHENKALADPRVRRALTYAVDVEGIIGDLYGEAASEMKAPLTQAVFGAPELEPQPFDAERARGLLAEAGYADGLSLEMIWPNDAAPNVREFAQALISGWADVGVTVEPFALARAQWTERFDGGDYDLSLFENVTTTGDADYTLNRLYTCAADRMGYCDPELDTYLSGAAASLDQDERQKMYAQASQILWEDAVSLWLMEMNNTSAVRNNVEGFSVQPTGMVDFAAVSVTSE